MSNTYKENIKLITEYYSGSSRADLAIEEMAELQKALLKFRRADRDELMTLRMKDVIEKIADMKIMLDQLSLNCMAAVTAWKRWSIIKSTGSSNV